MFGILIITESCKGQTEKWVYGWYTSELFFERDIHFFEPKSVKGPLRRAAKQGRNLIIL
jgi:hypothetical protein